jgi:hypothetical protein
MRRSLFLTATLVACGWLATSCGGDSESDSGSGGKGGTGNTSGAAGTSATGGNGNTGGGTAGAGGGAAGAGGGISDAGAQCGSMTCSADYTCCPGLEYCYPSTCTNCCPSTIDGGSGGSGGTTGNDGGPTQCGNFTCTAAQSCCTLGSIQYCYQTSCTFCCQGTTDGGLGGFGGFGGFDAGFGGFGNFGGFDAGFGGFGNFGGGSSDAGTTCGALTCTNGFSCCKNQYCYPSACLSCCL